MEALTDTHFSVASHNDSLIYIRHIQMDAFVIKRKETKTDFKRQTPWEASKECPDHRKSVTDCQYQLQKTISTYNKRVWQIFSKILNSKINNNKIHNSLLQWIKLTNIYKLFAYFHVWFVINIYAFLVWVFSLHLHPCLPITL